MRLDDVAQMEMEHIHMMLFEIWRMFETGLGEHAILKPLTP
jgi:hypothetical protein